MSSKPKVLIAPKKKKKKPLIIVSKKKASGGASSSAVGSSSTTKAGSSTARPASPNTVAAAAGDTTASASIAAGGNAGIGNSNNAAATTTIHKPKKSRPGAILIKPFEKPPELPPDFYDSSLDVLRRALTCVLRHEALLASSNDVAGGGAPPDNNANAAKENNKGRRLIGREELYRSVEDLCVHKFGTKLYYDVVKIMEVSAGEVVRRLASTTDAPNNASSSMDGHHDEMIHHLDAIADGISGDVGYNATQLLNDLNLKDGGVVCGVNDLSMMGSSGDMIVGGESYSEKRHALLRRMHSVCRVSYAEEYLTFVRSIFLALDRAYVYYAEGELEEIGAENDSRNQKLSRQAMGMDDSMMEVDDDMVQNNMSSSRGPPGGKVVERSSASTNSSRIWGLWEVGIACLRQHMVRSPHVAAATNKALATSTTPSDSANSYLGTLSVLTAMVVTTTYAILSEYDHYHHHNTGAGGDNLAEHNNRPLLRNCVRTIVDLGSLPSLLEELIVVASARFDKEGKAWGMALGEGKRSAPEFLLHVETRLRQSAGLASYYLPGWTNESVVALRRLSNLPVLTGAIPLVQSSSLSTAAKSDQVTWDPVNNSTRRILPAIIEKQLLGPHLSNPTCGVLEPRHLYPMLDDDTVGMGGDMAWKHPQHSHSGGLGGKTYENAKRLYSLCWRMTAASASSSSSSSPSELPMPSGGLNRPVPSSALDHLRLAFGEYGRLRGSAIIRQGMLSPGGSATNNTKEMEKKVIPDLLAFKNHLYSLLNVAFRGEASFNTMVRSILEDVLNGGSSGSSMSNDDDGDGGRRIAELLAKHVDLRFKDAKASATVTASSAASPAGSANPAAAVTAADANESFQNEILALFRHIHSKDVFEAFYKRDLAKRLLTGRAVSTDMERSFLSKLKAECGAGYTSKMEGMFKDMELSRDIMGSYTAYTTGAMATAAGGPPVAKAVDMDVQVLTTGYWPVYPKYPNIILPPELLALRTKFETYYDDKYQGRRIAWQYSLGNCIVKASFPKSAAPKELIVNVCQTLVLLCFRNGDGEDGRGLTLDEIMKKTGIEDRAELERVLQSLCMGRDGTRVLKKVDYDSPTERATPSKASPSKDSGDSPKKKLKTRMRRNVGPHDRFIFNSSFSCNQRRIRITNITMKETSEERTKTHASVSKDRLYFIDAAVVRIMKARKTIDHRGLIGEVMAQLKFPATGADIKKRIESLIEREYMERVEGDRSKYKYLA